MKNKCINDKKLTTYYYKEIKNIKEFRDIDQHIKLCPNCKLRLSSMKKLTLIIPKIQIDNIELNFIEDNNKKNTVFIEKRFPLLKVACIVFFIIAGVLLFSYFNNSKTIDSIEKLSTLIVDDLIEDENEDNEDIFFLSYNINVE